MRILIGKETCCICGKPGRYLLGSKPDVPVGYFNAQWYCEEHLFRMTDELKKSSDFNKLRGQFAEFKVVEPEAITP